MAPQPSTSRRGPLWDTYKHFYQHRHVESGTRQGVVTRRLYSTKQLPSQEPSDLDRFEVLWWDEAEGNYDDSEPDQLLYPQLKGIVTDKFVDRLSPFTPPVIEHVILPLQGSNWSASDQEHAAMLAQAKQASHDLRAQGKQAEKELDQLIIVTEEEQGLQNNPPKPDKPAKPLKKPDTATAAAAAAAEKDKDTKAASNKGKNRADEGPNAAAAAGLKAKTGTAKKVVASKALKSASAAAEAAAGPGSSKQAAAAAKQTSDSGLAGSCDEAEDSKTFDASEDDDELSSDFESPPSDKVQPAAAAAAGGKKRKQQQPEKPDSPLEKASKKQKSSGGAAAAAAGGGGGGGSKGVRGVTGRSYPAEVVFAAGDRKLGSAAYAEGGEDGEYPVECIVDEVEIVARSKGKIRKQVKVLPKWQGYELDPHGWEDKAGLKQVEAYVKWADAANKPAYFTALSNDEAAKAYVTWSTGKYKTSKKKK